jgi:hypothetical protein
VYIDVADNSLSGKWLTALNTLVADNYHLEKNYCFLGFPDSARDGAYIVKQINTSIRAINTSDLRYEQIELIPTVEKLENRGSLMREVFNQLHRHFELLQGGSNCLSEHYIQADPGTRWHIRQLNLLCHEFESWILSKRKQREAPEWMRPSQLMCWLGAPRYTLDEADYDLFGINTINRSLGGVYVGVNKAVGKHHYEVFCDEGRDSRVGELVTTTLKAQTQASGDFDIEWARDPGAYEWQIRSLTDFRVWLLNNGFDPEDKTLTLGHPQVGQVDLLRSFGTEDYRTIWSQLNTRLNVTAVRTSQAHAVYDYSWADADYQEQQIQCLG